MKKTHILMAGIVAIAVIVACRKQVATPPPSPSSESLTTTSETVYIDGKSYNKVEQKFYPVNRNSALLLIKNLRGSLSQQDESKVQGRLIEDPTVHVDSALFVLEMALNYDFDYQFSNNDTSVIDKIVEISDFTIPIDVDMNHVQSDDLEGVYDELKTQIDYLINNGNGRRVRVVDIESYISGGEVTFQARTETFFPWKITTVQCNQITNASANYFASSAGDGVVALTLYPFAKLVMNKYLDWCAFPPSYCPSTSTFYSNITTTIFDNSTNLYSGTLYYQTIACSATNHKYNDNTVLTKSQVDNYLTSCATAATNALPSTSHKVISPIIDDICLNCMDFTRPTTCPTPIGVYPAAAIYRVSWEFRVTYGIAIGSGC